MKQQHKSKINELSVLEQAKVKDKAKDKAKNKPKPKPDKPPVGRV